MTQPAEVYELEIDSAEVEAGLKRLDGAFDHFGARQAQAFEKGRLAMERQVRAAGGIPPTIDKVSAAYQRLQGRLDPVIAAQQRYEREMLQSLGIINNAVRLGVATEAEATATITRLKAQQVEAITRVRDAQLASNRAGVLVGGRGANDNLNTANIAAQIQDIGVTSAMGMSPLQIALQQGTQLQAVFGPMGAAGAVRALGAAFVSLINPVSLATLALVAGTAAAVQWFMSSKSGSDQAKEAVDRYRASVEALRSAYGGATEASAEFTRQSLAQLAAAERLERINLQNTAKAQREALDGQLGGMLGPFPSWVGSGLGDVKMIYEPFTEAIERLRKQLREGRPDFDSFNRSVQQTAAADPSKLQQWADRLLGVTSAAEGSERTLKGAARSILDIGAAARGQLWAVDDFAASMKTLAGIKMPSLSDEESALAALEKGMRGGAGGYEERRALMSQYDAALERVRTARLPTPTPRPNIEMEGMPWLSKAATANPYKEIMKSADQRINQLRIEADALNLTGSAAAGLRFKQELLNQAIEKDVKLSGPQLAAIEKKRQQYEDIAENHSRAVLAGEITFAEGSEP